MRRRRRRPNHQVLEVAAGGRLDRRRQLRGVEIWILEVVRGNRQRREGLRLNAGDVSEVYADCGVALRGVRQRRREHVAGVGGVLQRRRGPAIALFPYTTLFRSRRRRRRPNHQVLEVAAGGRLDRRRQLRGVEIWILEVVRGNRQRPGGLAVMDDDVAEVGDNRGVALQIGRASCRERVWGVGGGR